MRVIPEKCVRIVNEKQISLAEKGCRIKFHNPDRKIITNVDVDCAMGENAGLRCDGLLIEENDSEHFVELKKEYKQHAIVQLENTIEKLCSRHKNEDNRAYIIIRSSSTKAYDLNSIKRKFKKKHNFKLSIERTGYEVRL